MPVTEHNMQLINIATAVPMAGAVTANYSLEITARDLPALQKVTSSVPAGTTVALTFLPGETSAARIEAIRGIHALGFDPMPHLAARSVQSTQELEDYLGAARESDATQCFVVAGDATEPNGPFADSTALIATGMFENYGMKMLGLGGHPEAHPHMTDAECWQVLDRKCSEVAARGMSPLIVTQFAFDADRVLLWLAGLRSRGITAPVRLGVPGPAGITTLMRFAARCGVGASASVLAKYGISIGKLLGSAGPDRLVNSLSNGIGTEHSLVSLHFYPFGGIERTVAWIDDYNRSHRRACQI